MEYDKYRKSGIYKIVNITNNKIYVGSSKYLKARKTGHFGQLRRNQHKNIHLQSSYNKHGKDCFRFEILEECSIQNLMDREQYWIDTLKPQYNILKIAGSSRGELYKHDKERCFKVSIKTRHLTDEQVYEIIELQKQGKTIKELCNIYDFEPASLSRILSGHLYKHIGIPEKEINKNIRPNKLQDKELVLEIYNKAKLGEFQYKLAEEYNIDQSTVCRIKNKQRNFEWLKELENA